MDERRLIWRGSGCTVERRGPFVQFRIGDGTAIVQPREVALLTAALQSELRSLGGSESKPTKPSETPDGQKPSDGEDKEPHPKVVGKPGPSENKLKAGAR